MGVARGTIDSDRTGTRPRFWGNETKDGRLGEVAGWVKGKSGKAEFCASEVVR